MTLRPCADTSQADWLLASGVSWHQVVGFGPAGFEAYARLRFIPDPVRPGQHEGDVEVPDDHPSDWSQALSALDVLARFTQSERWFICVWEGSGHDVPPAVFREPLVGPPERRYFMAEGTSDDLAQWETMFEHGQPVPALVWPADRAWCFASDVDAHWAGIGASAAAVQALMSSGLDVVPADPEEPQPTYY